MDRKSIHNICLSLITICCLCLSSDWAQATARTLTVVYNRGIAPIQFTTENGEPSGILNDYWKLVGEKGGFDFRFLEAASFKESLDALQDGRADLHAGLFYTDERSRQLQYSHPVFGVKYYIYSGPGLRPFTSLSEIKGYLLGVVQGGYTEDFITRQVPGSHLVIFADVASLFKAVINGDIKVFVASDVHLNYYLSTHKRANTFHRGEKALYEQSYYGATGKNNQALIEKLRIAQQMVSEQELRQLKQKWLSAQVEAAGPLLIDALTPEEIAWISEHQKIRVSNELDWPPFDFNRDGQPLGISLDLLEMISSRTGLKFEYVWGPSWDELEEMLRNKELDVVHSLTYSSTRAKFMLFTRPYVSNQMVIVTSSATSDIHDIEDLENKTVAVISGYNQERVLRTFLDHADFIYVASPLEALKAVAAGRADATIRFSSVANYLIHRHLLTNLKFVNEFEVADDTQDELVIGVRDDWPTLRSILNKGLASISHAEMDELFRKWALVDVRKKAPKVDLNETERQWLQDNPEITLGSDYRWPPFDLADQNGKHSGVSADYVRLVAERTGLKIKVRTGVWADILNAVQNGELDGLACAVPTEERNKYLDFTRPYLRVPTVIIVRKENGSIKSLNDLHGRTVSINNGSYMHEWMARRYPKVRLQLSTSNEASLEAVSYGEVDAYIGNLAVADYIIREKLLTNLKVVKRLPGMMTETALGVTKDKPVLLGILQKGLDTITIEERQEILDKWYIASVEDRIEEIAFTDKEQAWLRKHPLIKVAGAPDWAPVSYLDPRGEYSGIVTEYLKKIATISDLQFVMQPAGSWQDALQMVRDGLTDIISGISRVEGKTEGVEHTDSYMEAEAVLVTRDDIQFIKGLDPDEDYRVGTIRDYVIAEQLQRDYPALSLQLYPNGALGLQALSHGDIDIFVIDIPTFEYYTRKHSLANLKISGVTPYAFQIAFGVAPENPELVSILNKTLSRISQKEKNEIYSSWVTRQEPLIDYSMIWKVVLAASVFLLLLFYWNRRLVHEASLRKQAEHAAVQASRAKSDFLANMSHEIRTPMNSVLGFAELLDNMITDPEQKSYLKSIRSGGRALLEIINDILDLSKIEAGKMTLKSEPFSLAGLFAEMDDFFKARIAQKNLQFIVQLPDDFPAYIKMDHVRLRQILINLIGNSLKFTETGTIRLGCDEVLVDEETEYIAFTLSVADTGIGIAPDQQQGIFDKFAQQEDFDSAKYGGTGLGLSICRSLTELMGGTISVASTPGQGAEFRVAFSGVEIVRDTVVQEEIFKMSVSQFGEANVLIVDDVQDNRKLVIGHFRDSAISFHEATNGRDALKLLSQLPVDLVLMDLRMPELNGYETITAMRQDESLDHIPVVAFTASVMGEDLEKVNQYGFDGYLRKPVSRQELLEVAARFLPQREASPAAKKEIDDLTGEASILLSDFLESVEKGLMQQWEEVKDSGDFDLIGQFAETLHRQATDFSISSMVDFANRLREYITSFDIIEVDNLMQQFPKKISLLQQQMTAPGGRNEKEI